MTRVRRPRYLELGSISTGTLRDEDVIPALLDACDTVRMSQDDREQARDLRKEWKAFEADEDNRPEWGHESASEIWEELIDLLNNYSPPYCYVGAHEGDGADIGVWISNDAMENDDGVDLWKDSDPEPERWIWHLVTSDHGNMTLYDRRGREVWGVV